MAAFEKVGADVALTTRVPAAVVDEALAAIAASNG